MISFDYYCIETWMLYELLHYVKDNHIKLWQLSYKDNLFYFYIPTYQRHLIKHINVKYINTIGLLKYILLFIKPLNMIGLMSFIGMIFICTHLIFNIKVVGIVPNININLYQTLYDQGITEYSFLKNYEELNDLLSFLKDTYRKDIEYINLYQTGSVLYIEYTRRHQDIIEEDDYRNIYAVKDGMIAYFDIDSGFIEVDINDYVTKGDLLVSNEIISTTNDTKIIPVKGHVYAYTYNEYEAVIDNSNQDNADAFYELLLKIRSQIPTDVIIDKENVLQINKTSSTITLKMHYTLLEDIGTKET